MPFVISRGEEALLIDTGEEDDGEKILEYMESQGIRQVQTMILTHLIKIMWAARIIFYRAFPWNRCWNRIMQAVGNSIREYADTKENAGEVRAVTAEETFSFARGDGDGISVGTDPGRHSGLRGKGI